MGLYDRDYGREYGDETAWDRHQRQQERSQKPKSVTIILIAVTAVIWLIDTVTVAPLVEGGAKVSQLAQWFAASDRTIVQPWNWFQFLTYGFLHDHSSIRHLLFNMIGLFFFGRIIEERLGRGEFLRYYLVAIVVGGIVGSSQYFLTNTNATVIGASGAVVATVILFACYHPHAKILLMFVIPVKAWIVAVLFVAYDTAGALGITGGESNTAFTVHLSGAAFALLYYKLGWNLGWLDFTALGNVKKNLQQRSRRMKLKIHDPDRNAATEAAEADRILAKIHESGEASLTSAERKALEKYSRRQRAKRNE